MTTPREEEDVVVTLRLQPVVARPQGWRGRSSSMVAIGLVAFLVVAVVLGTAFDDERPAGSAPIAVASLTASQATPRPTAHPTVSREPLPTPLPALEVLGVNIPTERRFVNANGFELLDLATGELTRLARPFDYPSLPLLLPNDEIVCACVARQVTSTATGSIAVPSLRFGRFDQTGAPIIERDLRSFDGAVAVNEMTEGFNLASSLDPDRRWMYVLVAERRPPVWTITLLVVEVETGNVAASVDVGRVSVDVEEPDPSASPSVVGGPPDGVYLWPISVAVAPGGQAALVSIDRTEVRNGTWTNQTLEWMVELAPGNPATSTLLVRPAALEPGGWCMNQPTFVDADLLVQVCAIPADTPAGLLSVRRIGSDGETIGDFAIAVPQVDGGYPMSIVVDRSQRAIDIWQIQRHVLVRIDIDTGEVTEVTVHESMLPQAGVAFDRQGYIGGDPGLILSPDGRHLYAIGVAGAAGGRAGVPSGVWVFESDSLRLVDHWEPRAFLSSLAVSRDGRFVYAAGAAGYDVNGRQNPWPASVTVYEAATGEIQVVYGAVARDTWLSFAALP